MPMQVLEPTTSRHETPTLRSRVSRWALNHPLATTMAIGASCRIVVAIVIAITNDGTLFKDDESYAQMGREMAAGATEDWDPYTRWLFGATGTYLIPLTASYWLFGAEPLAGQLVSVTFGVATVAAVCWLALRSWGSRAALVAGLAVAVLPSQILWSSLTLKDAAVWAVMSGVAVAVKLASTASSRQLIAVGVAIAVFLVLLGHLRDHSLALASLALLPSAWFGAPARRKARLAGAFAVGLTIPWALGIGPFGAELAAHGRSLGHRRAMNALDANTAVVAVPTTAASRPGVAGAENPDSSDSADGPEVQEVTSTTQPTDHSPADIEVDEGIGANLAHLPRGLSVILVEPLPWQAATSTGVRVAKLEAIVWYPLLGAALAGVVVAWRRRMQAMAFPALIGAGTILVYALSEGSLGTAYRHRGELAWVAALFAAAALSRVSQRSRRDADER